MTIQFFIFTITISRRNWTANDVEKELQHKNRSKQLEVKKEQFRTMRYL